MNYKSLYFHLYACVADAVELLEKNKPEDARTKLIASMGELETYYVDCNKAKEGNTKMPPE